MTITAIGIFVYLFISYLAFLLMCVIWGLTISGFAFIIFMMAKAFVRSFKRPDNLLNANNIQS